MQRLTPRLHGVVDYAACAVMLVAPSLLRLSPQGRTVSLALAGSYLGVSLLTDYPTAVKRVIPFPLHGKIELGTLPALLLLGARMQSRDRAYLLGLAGMVAGAYALTDWEANPDT